MERTCFRVVFPETLSPCHVLFVVNRALCHSIYCFLVDFSLRCHQGIGNGIPIGAVVTTPEIAQVLTRRNYFNTFGGNPVCTAAGHAVLRVIEKEKLQENAAVVGSYLKDRFVKLQDKHESRFLFSYTF